MKKIQISPSILSADFSQLGVEIKRLEDGGADMIHVDVMDGHFVPNLTIGPPVIKALKKHCSLQFDVHLMISPVHKYIEAYANAGADIITFHPEATESIPETVGLIRKLGKKVDFTSLPYSKFSSYSIETAGHFDLDAELQINISGVGLLTFEFKGKSDIKAISRHITQSII